MSACLRRASSVVLVAALLMAGAATARAQTKESADNKTAAKEHYDKGRSFYDLGRYDDAIKEFEAAYELKNDPAFLYNLAQSYRQVGNHDQALHFYKTYLRYLPKGASRADIEEKIKTEEQAVAQKGGGTTPPPANTTPPPTNTTPPPANTTPPPTNTPPPGGTEPNVVVPPVTPPPGYTPPGPGPGPGFVPPPASATDPGRKFRIAGIASAGAGAVMWVVGIIEWRRAVKASSDIEDAAVAGQAFDPAVQSRGKSAETLQWVFYGLGTLAVGAGAGLWFYGQHVTAAETTTWRVSLAPVIAPNQGGATLRIAF